MTTLTGYALLDEPNKRYTQGQAVRRGGNKPVGLAVIHTFEITADWFPPDLSAESGLRYLQTRTTPGCYHRLSDADSRLPLYPFEYETWHCAPTNKWSNGFCMATQANSWPKLPADHAERLLLNCARDVAAFIAWMDDRGVKVPIKWIDRDAALGKQPGLTMHRITDPSRRHDPGFLPTSRTGQKFLTMVGDLVGNDEEVAVQPDVNRPGLLVDGDFQTFTIKALQRALWAANTDVGPADGDFGVRSKKAYQTLLKRRGWYGGRIDGDFGCLSVSAEQRYLHSLGFYRGDIDCDRGTLTIKALQNALNKDKIA